MKKVGVAVIEDMENKLALFPNPSNNTLPKVLICNEGADVALTNRAYFDDIITLN